MLADMNAISSSLGSLKLGLETGFHTLTMFPLLNGGSHDVRYLTLDEALSQAWAEITEVSEQGRVSELKVLNRAPSPVLIVDGEELVGAKQNRIVNLSILVPAHSTLTIPVSCVEAGRWHARSRAFSSAPRTHYAAGRAMKMRQVTRAMVDRGERHSDQSAVWSDIASKAERLRAPSSTGAAEAMYERHHASLESYVEACVPVERQVGALFAIGDRLVGLDLFDSAATFRRLLPKLVRSYALDAMDAAATDVTLRRVDDAGRRNGASDRRRHPAAGTGSLRAAADLFLRLVAEADTKSVAAVGLGTDVRLVAPSLAGAALVHEERLVHLSAFAN